MAGEDDNTLSAQPSLSGTELLAQQLASLLKQLNPPATAEIRSSESTQNQTVTISIKLNEFNYSLWSRMMHLAISGRGCLNHITGYPSPPKPTEPNYHQWYQNDLTVISWLIQNMEPTLANNYVQYKSAEGLWKGLATTYSVKKDSAQIFELTIQANSIKQGQGTIEHFYNTLQRIWAEIDESHPNPMECEKDISTYHRIQSETRLFQLLARVNEKFEPERRYILKLDPLPNVEAAYALLRQGTARRGIWTSETDGTTDREIGSGLTAHGDSDAVGLAAKGFRPASRSNPGPSKGTGSATREKIDKSKLKCSHCGISKHTKETCFRLVGYPEWWEDNHKPPKKKETHGRVAAAIDDTEATGHRMGDNRRSRRWSEQQ